MDEIRKEIKSTDPHIKSTALSKLTYLSSVYGYDMSWAAFHAVEVISYPQFSLKKIGYLAASASFNEDTEVLLLMTNQFRKDLSSPNDFEVSLALQCLSVIGTTDLCRDLCHDLFTLLSSTRIHVKKKAIAVILRVFTKYPDAVRVCFKRLVENLESSDPQSVCSAVGVFCELTLQDPKTYLPLAPEFYRVLLDCRNNWVLIKVLKIFAKLAPLEPRLGRKIVEPICEIMSRTMAKSLLFECVRTVVNSLSDHESAVRLALSKVREFLVDDDPNLKYLGLQAFSDLTSRHLWAVLENKEVVVRSLSDPDPNIKVASLRLLMAMVSEDNVAEITKVLLNYALKSDPEFCNEILRSILITCSKNYYEIVFDFDWYVSLLGEMSRILHCQVGEEIESQLIDIGMRVKDARPELVNVGRDLLIDPALLGNPFLHRILSAAAWVSGEYVEFSRNPIELIEALLQPRTNLLPPSIRAVYIQSVFKVLVFFLQFHLWRQDEGVSSLFADGTEGGSCSMIETQLLEGNDLATYGSLTNSGLRFCARDSSRSVNENGDDVVAQGQSVSLAVSGREISSLESVMKMLNFIETAMEPLSFSHEVEVQDRARNILGVVQLVKQYFLGCSDLHEESSGKKESETSEIVKLITDLFSEELGPVSASAQARIPLPDGLTFQEDLSELDTIFDDIQLQPSTSFSLGTSRYRDKAFPLTPNDQFKEDSESSTKSESLLAEHRQRHGLYYLPSGKDGAESADYPPANENKVEGDRHDETSDLVKLTEQSLSVTKKPSRAKPRPVVVKLDDGENFIPANKLESQNDMLSGAVRDVLLGNEEVSTSSYGVAADPSSKRKGKETLVSDGPLDLRENSVTVDSSDIGNPSSRRSKHKALGKKRNQHSHVKNGERREENSHKEKKKTSRDNHSRHKGDGKGAASSIVQTTEIPDFLL